MLVWQMDASGSVQLMAAGYGHVKAVAAVAFSRYSTKCNTVVIVMFKFLYPANVVVYSDRICPSVCLSVCLSVHL